MCKACGPYAKLNPEPSEVTIYLLRRHRENGTVPNFPKWYSAHWRACTSQNYQHEVTRINNFSCTVRDSLPKTIAPQVLRIPGRRYKTTKKYVREFERLNNLKAST